MLNHLVFCSKYIKIIVKKMFLHNYLASKMKFHLKIFKLTLIKSKFGRGERKITLNLKISTVVLFIHRCLYACMLNRLLRLNSDGRIYLHKKLFLNCRRKNNFYNVATHQSSRSARTILLSLYFIVSERRTKIYTKTLSTH